MPSVPEGLGAVLPSSPLSGRAWGRRVGAGLAGPSEAQEEWAPPVSRAVPPRKSPVGAAGGLSGKGQGCWGLGPWCSPPVAPLSVHVREERVDWQGLLGGQEVTFPVPCTRCHVAPGDQH